MKQTLKTDLFHFVPFGSRPWEFISVTVVWMDQLGTDAAILCCGQNRRYQLTVGQAQVNLCPWESEKYEETRGSIQITCNFML